MLNKRILRSLSLILVFVTVLSCSAFAYDAPNSSYVEDVEMSTSPAATVEPRTVYYTISEPLGAYMLTGAGAGYSRVRDAAFPCGLSLIHILTKTGNDGKVWVKCTTVPNAYYGETKAYTGWIRKDLITYSGSVYAA